MADTNGELQNHLLRFCPFESVCVVSLTVGACFAGPSLDFGTRPQSIDAPAREASRDLRACRHQPKSAPSCFSPPCSRSAPGYARRRRSAPNRRRRVRRREQICTGRSWPWTPQTPPSGSPAGRNIGRSDRFDWGSRLPMGPTPRSVPIPSRGASGGKKPRRFLRIRRAAVATLGYHLPQRSTWTELRSGRFSRSPRSDPRLRTAF